MYLCKTNIYTRNEYSTNIQSPLHRYTVMRKHISIFAAILIVYLSSNAQVNFSARVFDPTGKQLYDCFCFSLRVECENTTRFHNWCDTSTITHFNNIPIGSRCHFIYSELGGKMYDYPVFTINSFFNRCGHDF